MIETIAVAAAAAAVAAQAFCVPAGTYADEAGKPVATAAMLERIAGARIVLLGERHATPAHHRWQASVVEALRARGRPVAIGLEQLPRAAQGALDSYIAGRLDEAAFLRTSRWAEHWGHDFAAYRPLFEAARAGRVPMIALNVDHAFVRRVAREGFDTAAGAGDAPIGKPAPPPEPYAAMLREVFAAHGGKANAGAADRFIEAQTVWDRAMAEGLAAAAAANPGATIVGVMGSGHVEGGNGVAHQLKALGAPRALSLLPARATPPCDAKPGSADGFFGA